MAIAVINSKEKDWTTEHPENTEKEPRLFSVNSVFSVARFFSA